MSALSQPRGDPWDRGVLRLSGGGGVASGLPEQNGTEITLNAKQRRAAVLVAEDNLTDVEIAKEIGIGRTTLHNWKGIPSFQDAVAERAQELDRAMLRLAIARRRYRVGRLNELESKLWDVIQARSEDDELTGASGGSTGLIVKDVKAVGAGPSATLVDVYSVDTSLIREIRGLHEQAAKELGQWSEKREVTGAEGGPLAVQMIEIVAPPEADPTTDGED